MKPEAVSRISNRLISLSGLNRKNKGFQDSRVKAGGFVVGRIQGGPLTIFSSPKIPLHDLTKGGIVIDMKGGLKKRIQESE